MNEHLAKHVVEELMKQGIEDFCICPGARNGPFVMTLSKVSGIRKYFWYEERSAAFFALGKSKKALKPTAVITTSGTAAGELLPATMEAYYTGIPLLLLTADRPRRFRGSGAPQSAEQVGLFGPYINFSQDLEGNERCDLSRWKKNGPAHLNVCFEEPKNDI